MFNQSFAFYLACVCMCSAAALILLIWVQCLPSSPLCLSSPLYYVWSVGNISALLSGICVCWGSHTFDWIRPWSIILWLVVRCLLTTWYDLHTMHVKQRHFIQCWIETRSFIDYQRSFPFAVQRLQYTRWWFSPEWISWVFLKKKFMHIVLAWIFVLSCDRCIQCVHVHIKKIQFLSRDGGRLKMATCM